MPLFMDKHLGGTDEMTAKDVADAHMKDLEIQGKYDVRYITYWFDYRNQTVFCLAEAPTADAAAKVHLEAHGLVANEIIEVDQHAVLDFMGKITEPQPGEEWNEVAFRTVLFTDIQNSTEITQKMGDKAAMELIRTHNDIIRRHLGSAGGREVKHTGDGIMASFSSVSRAVECAIGIQRSLEEHRHDNPHLPLSVRIGMSAGEPVEESNDLFGATVQLAARLCSAGQPGGILVSNVVRELCLGKTFSFEDTGEVSLKGFAEPVRVYQVAWR